MHQHEAINPFSAKFRPHAGEGQEFKHGLNNWPWESWWKYLEGWGHPTKYWIKIKGSRLTWFLCSKLLIPKGNDWDAYIHLYSTYHSFWSSKTQSLLSNLTKQHCHKGASICQSLHQNQVVGDSTFPTASPSMLQPCNWSYPWPRHPYVSIFSMPRDRVMMIKSNRFQLSWQSMLAKPAIIGTSNFASSA